MNTTTAWQFWFNVRKASTIMERSAEALLSAQLDISFGQFMILSVIDAHPGPLNQTAIADHLGLTKGTVSRLIEAGAEAGWIVVEADPASRRSRLISLSEPGEKLVRQGDALLEGSSLMQTATADEASIQYATATLQGVIDAMVAGSAPSALPPARHPLGE
ncbi:MAG: MarR family transcriptional regulator [Propionibacteriaceae bacterium]|nr:MarR family transcriptional regulator [Propionibacteriaceae bacterium]